MTLRPGQRNIVLHFVDGTSDKVYISQIRESNGQYVVVGKWGRRGKSMAEQVKLITSDYKQASTKMFWLATEKMSKGYKDITSSGYPGVLRVDDSWLQQHLAPDNILPRSVKTIRLSPPNAPKSEPKEKEMELICIDNAGYENHFDQGVEYICQGDPKADDLYFVYDKFGEQISVFKNRFKFVL